MKSQSFTLFSIKVGEFDLLSEKKQEFCWCFCIQLFWKPFQWTL